MSNSRLAYWRKRRGLSQQQLAAMAGATQAAVSQMERDQRAPKGLYTALKLAAALEVAVTAIWPGAAPTTRPQHRARSVAAAGRPSPPTSLKNQGKRKC